ncbi:MAG: Ig-like domain-containing protein [Bacteroidales bacterium]|nr:Ig-like domain-containing protein [Bacteroidales bacterium]
MRVYPIIAAFLVVAIFFCTGCKKKSSDTPTGSIQLAQVKAGPVILKIGETAKDVPVDSSIYIYFNNTLDPSSANGSILLTKTNNTEIPCDLTLFQNNTAVRLVFQQPLDHSANYRLQVTSGLKGINGETFTGVELLFTTIAGKLTIETITINKQPFQVPMVPKNINGKKDSVKVEITFSDPLDPSTLSSFFTMSSGMPLIFSLTNENKKLLITNSKQLTDYSRCFLNISKNLTSQNGFPFDGFYNAFYTALDSTPKFPIIPDDQLLTLVQEQTFRYFYDFAHPNCGLARERNTSGDVVTIGGSGFGVMALIVGMERGFITRDQGLTRMNKILTFLETCDRYHGAWPHWLNGSTGRVHPFTTYDDGADLVETSYMIEGLIAMKQYLDAAIPAEQTLIQRITTLTDAVEYDWFRQNGQNVLYWHWSPNYQWHMNMPIQGYNETLITYIVAATSTTHPIPAVVYHQGYAKSGAIKNGNSYYGYRLPLGDPYGGPLFFTHYSFLGLDPRNLQDQYANYWEQNVNQSLINWTHCFTNPNGYMDYSKLSWGLTASDNPWGYDAQSPANDLGVITPTAAISALPYVPTQSMNTIRFFYYQLGDRLWGNYGFYDAYDVTEGWWADSYLAIDEGPIVCMIENYRTALLWNLFMSSPEVQAGLTKLGFTH